MLFCLAGCPNESPGSGNEREAGRLLFYQGHLARAFLGSSESNTEAACPVMGFPMSPQLQGLGFEFLLVDACLLESVQDVFCHPRNFPCV